jgi:hypothetical protein
MDEIRYRLAYSAAAMASYGALLLTSGDLLAAARCMISSLQCSIAAWSLPDVTVIANVSEEDKASDADETGCEGCGQCHTAPLAN